MYPTLQADPDRAAWIETTAAELARFGEQHRDELDAANRDKQFPRELYRELGKLGYLGPLVPAVLRRPGRRRQRVRGHQRGGRPARPGVRADRGAGAALAAGLGHRRAEGPVAARHRDRRGGVLRVDQREERGLVVQGHGVDRDPRRRRLAADRQQDARQPRRRLRRHAVLRDRRGRADQLPGRHEPARHPDRGDRPGRPAAHPHRRRDLRPGTGAGLGAARPARRGPADVPVHLQHQPARQRLGADRPRPALARARPALRVAAAGRRQHGHRLPGHPVDGRRRVDRPAGRVARPRRRRGRPRARRGHRAAHHHGQAPGDHRRGAGLATPPTA